MPQNFAHTPALAAPAAEIARQLAVVVVILVNLPQAHAPQRRNLELGFKERFHELSRILREVLVRHVANLAPRSPPIHTLGRSSQLRLE